ncbi:MAG: divalent-cation tolerance protein CutA [Armatimonadota bacterium]|nr:divalent-cation tolerance protein CutA [Armatimonadota bacterium]MDR7519840.1 divalent-cation tolerance protein CutA [Armatimonadota bacterium]
MEPLVILVTCSRADEASRIAQALVDEHLAACVNVVPGLRSVYRWQGRVEHADELLLIVKTSRDRLDEVVARVQGLHSYTVPEVIALPVQGGAAPYLAWLEAQVRAPAHPPGA